MKWLKILWKKPCEFLSSIRASVGKNNEAPIPANNPNRSIPEIIAREEHIIRAIYHPMNCNSKTGEIKMNTLRSPAGKDEVSILRKSYIGLNEARKFFYDNGNPAKNRNYKGFCALFASDIFDHGSEIIPDFIPIEQHANIVHGYIVKENQELPVELKLRLEALLTLIKEKNRYFEDPSPASDNWTGRPYKIE